MRNVSIGWVDNTVLLRRLPRFIWIVAALLTGLGIGVVAAACSVFQAVTSVVTLLAVSVAIIRPQVAVVGALVFAYLLPFAIIPIRWGVQPPIIDLTVAVALAAATARMVFGCSARVVGPVWLWLLAGVLACWGLALLISLRVGVGSHEVQYGLKLITMIAASALAVRIGANSTLVRQAIIFIAILGAMQSVVAVLVLQAGTSAILFFEALTLVGYPDATSAFRYLPDQETLRAVGTLVDPNILGASLAISAVMAFGLASVSFGKSRLAWLMVAGTIMPGLILSMSRGAWLALGIGVLIYLWRYDRKVALGVVLMASVFVTFAPLDIVAHFRSGLLARDEAAALRLDEFAEAMKVIQSSPIFGIGFPAREPAGYFLGVSNMFLWLAERIGLLGTTLHLIAAIVACRKGWNPRVRSPFAAVLATALAAILVAGLVDHHFASVPHMVMLQWSMMGMVVGASWKGLA